jgi:hypothetical protein
MIRRYQGMRIGDGRLERLLKYKTVRGRVAGWPEQNKLPLKLEPRITIPPLVRTALHHALPRKRLSHQRRAD